MRKWREAQLVNCFSAIVSARSHIQSVGYLLRKSENRCTIDSENLSNGVQHIVFITTKILVSTGFSKLGFFLVSLMTSDCTTPPAHSNSMLGDVTLESWNFFMFLTPQHKTYETLNTLQSESWFPNSFSLVPASTADAPFKFSAIRSRWNQTFLAPSTS